MAYKSINTSSNLIIGVGNKKVFCRSSGSTTSLDPRVSRVSIGGICEKCQRLPASRRYKGYHLCTPCFADLIEKDKKDPNGGKPYVQLLDRWLNNQPKEERIIGLAKTHHVKPSHPGIPSSYIKSFKEYDCVGENAKNIYPAVARIEGNPYYAEAKGYSSASRTYYKLRSYANRCAVEGADKGIYLCKLVLTFPKELSEHYYEKGEYERAWKLLKDFWVRLKEEFCRVGEDRRIREEMGAVVNQHQWKTSEPLKPHFHFHLSFLNIVMSDSGASSEGIRFSPQIDKGLLQWLKEKWRTLLEEEGKSLFGEGYELGGTDIHYDFVPLEERGKVLHSLKYQYRQWIVDFCDWSERMGYEGKIPWKMQRNVNKARVFGFWRRLGMDEEAKEELKELKTGKRRICPFCEEVTEKVGEMSPEELWDEEKKGRFVWYEYGKKPSEGLKRVNPPGARFFSYVCLPGGMYKAPSKVPMYEE